MHQDGGARGRQRQRRQQEPGFAPRPPCAVAGPVERHRRPAWGRPGQRVPRRLDQPGDLVRRLAAIAQQHQKRAHLLVRRLAAQHHPQRLARLLPRQRARPPGTASQDAHVWREVVLGFGAGHAARKRK